MTNPPKVDRQALPDPSLANIEKSIDPSFNPKRVAKAHPKQLNPLLLDANPAAVLKLFSLTIFKFHSEIAF